MANTANKSNANRTENLTVILETSEERKLVCAFLKYMKVSRRNIEYLSKSKMDFDGRTWWGYRLKLTPEQIDVFTDSELDCY